MKTNKFKEKINLKKKIKKTKIKNKNKKSRKNFPLKPQSIKNQIPFPYAYSQQKSSQYYSDDF